MSIVAMNWVWAQRLAPAPKMVLLALADAADDEGVCWPSVPTLAEKCSISTRTVRRILQELSAKGLLQADARFRVDGSSTSNRYKLPIKGGDKLSGPPDTGDRPPGHGRQGPPDTRVTPRTTIEPKDESPPPHRPTPMPLAPGTGAPGDGGGGQELRLEFPKGLSDAERPLARKLVAEFPEALAQQLLDELAGRLAAGEVRVAPLAYLRGLAARARGGTFTPEAALTVAEKRRHQQQTEAALRQAKEVSENVRLTDGRFSDNPLVQRLLVLRNRSRGGDGTDQ